MKRATARKLSSSDVSTRCADIVGKYCIRQENSFLAPDMQTTSTTL